MAEQLRVTKNKELLLDALDKSMGIISTACKEAGVNRLTFYNYMKNDPHFRERVEEINEACIDMAETQLLKKIKEGDVKAIEFFLARRGRMRGYGWKVDVNIASEQIKFKFNLDEENIEEVDFKEIDPDDPEGEENNNE
jgi:hypothetical protein